MKQTYALMLFMLLCLIMYYLLLPNPSFPPSPPGSLQSNEPADTESIYRRAYYTNLSRADIMAYYTNVFGPSLRLNYPPEEAYPLIRDQTQSSYLEELVHPFRESLYINGFVPVKETEQINRNAVHYLGKITVKLVPSTVVIRLTTLLLTLGAVYSLYRVYA